MWPMLRKFFKKDQEQTSPTQRVLEILKNENGHWHPEYVKARIFEAEEKLYLQNLWQRVLRSLLILSALSSVAIVIIPMTTKHTLKPLYAAYAYSGAATLLVAFLIATYVQYKHVRDTSLSIKKLQLIRRKALLDQEETSDDPERKPLLSQKRYREDVPDLIAQYRKEANRNRAINNRFQSVVIVGSVITAAITTASVSYREVRWVAVVVSGAVGLAAGFTGYFKFHERSFSAQQAADAIEREYEAVELRVGKYAHKPEPEAYAIFADTVERLRDEQSKRQQQLDQPVVAKRDE